MKHTLLYLVLFSLPLCTEELKTVFYEALENEKGYALFARNPEVYPISIRMQYELVNMRVKPDRNVFVIPPKTERYKLNRLIQSEKREAFKMSYSYKTTKGDAVNAKHDSNTVYIAPFAHGVKYNCGQAWGGLFSHFGDNHFAIDFTMDIGTPVHAARGGIVIDIVEKYNRGGPSKEMGKYGNKIEVLHEDGSIAAYVHLRQWGAEVEVGQEVQVGDFLGYSGNTGRSTGPHLHFDVRVPTFGEQNSVPFLLKDLEGPVVPKEGHYYYSLHPEKPVDESFRYGRSLEHEDFKNYREAVSTGEQIELRYEEVDNTRIVYLRNPSKYDSKINLAFKLSGMTFSRGESHTLAVPAKTEVFAGFLRPISGAKSFQWRPTFSYAGAFPHPDIIADINEVSGDSLSLRSVRHLYTYHYFMSNPKDVDYEVELYFTKRQNIVAEPELPTSFILPANSEIFVTAFRPENPERKRDFRISYKYKEVN